MNRNVAGRLLLSLCLASFAGCTAADVQPETAEQRQEREQQQEERRKEEKKREAAEKRLNDLWVQGYGFGNDNAERRQKGLPPKNFDGTTGPYKPR